MDITARKEAEAKAQVAEERYRILAEEGPVMAYDVTLDHTAGGIPHLEPQYLSPRLLRLLGSSMDELRERPGAVDGIDPPRRPAARARLLPGIERRGG